MRNQILIGLAIAAIVSYSFIQNYEGIELIKKSRAAELEYATQMSNEREIKVTATLQAIQSESRTWEFEVVMETHTHALNDLLENSSVLITGGKQYKPLGWEGSPPGGHHRKGTLRFKAIDPKPESVDLQIRLIGDPTPRSFKWTLK